MLQFEFSLRTLRANRMALFGYRYFRVNEIDTNFGNFGHKLLKFDSVPFDKIRLVLAFSSTKVIRKDFAPMTVGKS